ncbi:MAG: hypothetical protein AAGH90_10985 [Pseudomonadota bacterium]
MEREPVSQRPRWRTYIGYALVAAAWLSVPLHVAALRSSTLLSLPEVIPDGFYKSMVDFGVGSLIGPLHVILLCIPAFILGVLAHRTLGLIGTSGLSRFE